MWAMLVATFFWKYSLAYLYHLEICHMIFPIFEKIVLLNHSSWISSFCLHSYSSSRSFSCKLMAFGPQLQCHTYSSANINHLNLAWIKMVPENICSTSYFIFIFNQSFISFSIWLLIFIFISFFS
jgi:hypothetical protein